MRKRILSILLTLALILTGIPSTVMASTQLTSKEVLDGYTIEFKVISDWKSGYNGEIKLTNTGSTAIESWALAFDYDHTITSSWSAKIVEHVGNHYVLKCLDWNADVKPGCSIVIGFSGNVGNIQKCPTNYDLCNELTIRPTQDFTTNYKVTSSWKTGFNSEIVIKNVNNTLIEDWVLEFDYDNTINSFWTAQIVSHVGNHYVIKNAGSNANIASGKTVKLGFSGVGNTLNAPQNIVLKSITINEVKGFYLELVNDNGVMTFAAKDIDSKYKYALGIKKDQKENARIIEVDTTKPVIVEKESLPGIYHYQLIGTSSSGSIVESNIINYLVTNNGEGLIGDDSDGDGLTNSNETILNTNLNLFDTDGDGLDDGYEYYILESDPSNMKTDEEGISDSEDDFDYDGLSNLEEYELGTNPLFEDTDGDGLTDKEELNTYLTDPLICDTDQDLLSDYDDILLGFDPLKVDSNDNGIMDYDEKIQQEVGVDNVADTLLQDNDAMPSLTVLTNGNVNSVAVIREYDSIEFGDSNSIIGKVVELTGFEFDSAIIKFEVSNVITPQVNMEGHILNKLLICHYSDEGGTEYLETQYDAFTNTVSAEINDTGIYFVLDVETLFGELGITLPFIKADTFSAFSTSSYVDIVNTSESEEYYEPMSIVDISKDAIINDGAWIYLDGPIPVPLKLNELPTEGSVIDSDGDGICDIKELSEITPSKEVNLDEIITIASGGLISNRSYGVVNCYEYISNPVLADSDNDGYSDEEDLAPLRKFVIPVVLIHGRNDNTANLFGVITDLYYQKGLVKKKLNANYNSQYSVEVINAWGEIQQEALDYNEYSTHIIKKIVKTNGGDRTPQNLGYELELLDDYDMNINLFAFNYPNQDMTKANAQKFSNYISNLEEHMRGSLFESYFYPTKEATMKINIIGHSNGGLVSRYYIENMGGSENVNKLITIDTPHWGSGLADVSDNLITLPLCYPMDIDLNPNSALFGSGYSEYSILNPDPSIQEKVDYINSNQTDPLNYENHGRTKYCFIAGYDIPYSEVPLGYANKNITFDILINDLCSYTFDRFKNDIKQGLEGYSSYPELAEDFRFRSALNFKSSDGDNVVNIQSQLGIKFEGDKDDSLLVKFIYFKDMWMNIDTFYGHSLANHFHAENPHRKETIKKVIEYLRDMSEPVN